MQKMQGYFRKIGNISRKTAFCIVLLCLGIDQFSKYSIVSWWSGEPNEITDFFRVVLVKNTGIIWGMMHDNNTYLSIFVSLFLTFLVYKIFTVRDKRLYFCLIFAGGLGNLLDRMLYGGVIDFLDFFIKAYHWPVFNFADILIFCGVACYILSSIGEGK